MALGNTQPLDLTQLQQGQQDIVRAINDLLTAIKQVFPLATGTATTATGGSITPPTQVVGYVEVFVQSLNETVKIPYYST